MARWRPKARRFEPPAWYRVFDPAAWDEPDAHERMMIDGNLGMPWPADLHAWHVERRWQAAKHAYRQAHPEFAEQEFNDLILRCRERREGMA